MFRKTLFLAAALLASQVSLAQPALQYEVTITNLTRGQSFTPQLVVTHPTDVILFELGEPASEALEILAEAGNTEPLIDELVNVASDVVTIGGLLAPGATVSTTITGGPRDFVSVAAMLIPTNDTFMALNRLPLPDRGGVMRLVPAYDAGTEENDQLCANIPGPTCGGEGFSSAPGEGYVYIGNGFHDLGEEALSPAVYDWNNAVARIVIRRM